MEKQYIHPSAYELADDYRKGKMNRREFLRFSALIGVSAGIASSLAGFAIPKRAFAATPKRGGTLRVSSMIGKLTHPAQCNLPQQVSQIRQVGETLTNIDNQNITHPYLLKKWNASEDLKTWILDLREGIRFNNNDELTSDDVVFTMGQWFDKDVKSSFLGLMGGYLDTTGIEKVNKYRVKLHLKRSEIAVPEHLAHYPGLILNHKTFEGDFLKAPHGTGPYLLESYKPGEVSILKARKDYWQKGADGKALPYLDSIKYIDLGGDLSPRIAALKNGEVDLVDQGNQLNPELMMAVKGNPKYTTYRHNTAICRVLRMRADVKPWSDNRIRTALKLCQNREKILALAYMNEGLIGQDFHVHPQHPEYCKKPYPKYDPDKARTLLKEAGYPTGLTVTLNVFNKIPDAMRFAEVIKADAEPAGFKININPTPKYFAKWTEWDLGITGWGHRPLGTMALNLAYSADKEGKPVPWNETHWVDDEFNNLLSRANGILDVDERRKIFCQLEQIQMERGTIGLSYWLNAWVVSTSKLKNYQIYTMLLNLADVWLET